MKDKLFNKYVINPLGIFAIIGTFLMEYESVLFDKKTNANFGFRLKLRVCCFNSI